MVYDHPSGEHRAVDEDTEEDSEYPTEVQCEGYTADGDRCERTVTLETADDEPYCYQHEYKQD